MAPGQAIPPMEAVGRRPVDFGFAEALAFGSLALEGTPVRLTGQDSERGNAHPFALFEVPADLADEIRQQGICRRLREIVLLGDTGAVSTEPRFPCPEPP